MAFIYISAKYPTNIDPTRVPLAYGQLAIPRLKRELHDENLLIRQRAIMALCDHLHDSEHIAESIRFGIDASLKHLLKDPDITVRLKAVECLCVMAGHAIGRESFLRLESIYPVAELFDDPENIVRKNAHMCLMMVSQTPVGAETIVEAQFVEYLVAKLQIELNQIKEIILDTMHFCMGADTKCALKAGAMEVFTTLLKNDLAVIRAKTARDIKDLSVPIEGKNKAVACGALQLLKKLLTESSTEVKAAAAGAIAMIAITTKGKYAAIHANSIPSLVALVDDINSEVRLNAITALTCLAEAPEGRQLLLLHLPEAMKNTMFVIFRIFSFVRGRQGS